MTNHSESINELASALSKAQGEMQAAIKDSVNPFFKSKYADLGSIWDAARPVLCKYGLCVMQSTDIVNDKIVLVTTLAHSSGQWMRSILPLNPAKNDSQGVGAAITYLRRYSLSALVGVVCDDDDDGNKDAQMRQPAKRANNPMPEPEIEYVSEPVISVHQAHEMGVLLTKVEPECKNNFMKFIGDNFGSIDKIHVSKYESYKRNLNLNIEKQLREKASS